jgi:tetratricopeptide (TPR) repeat protein
VTFKRLIAVMSFLIIAFVWPSFVSAQSSSPQDTLNQYISDLQKNSNDNALREKVIKHVQTIKPAPAIPEEARRYFIEGNALLKAAKAQKGYELAIDAYRQCLLIAPWWAEALYNYAVALDLANRFDEGMNALKLYIATNPREGESRKTQDKIYEIGAKKKLAAQEREDSSPQAVAAREEKKSDDWLKKLDGRRYTSPVGSGQTGVIDVRGKVFVNRIIGESGKDVYREDNRIEIQDRETTVRFSTSAPFLPVAATFIISEDGDRITYRKLFSDGDVREFIYLWKR